jgi:hypothetical protein
VAEAAVVEVVVFGVGDFLERGFSASVAKQGAVPELVVGS